MEGLFIWCNQFTFYVNSTPNFRNRTTIISNLQEVTDMERRSVLFFGTLGLVAFSAAAVLGSMGLNFKQGKADNTDSVIVLDSTCPKTKIGTVSGYPIYQIQSLSGDMVTFEHYNDNCPDTPEGYFISIKHGNGFYAHDMLKGCYKVKIYGNGPLIIDADTEYYKAEPYWESINVSEEGTEFAFTEYGSVNYVALVGGGGNEDICNIKKVEFYCSCIQATAE